MKHLLLPLLASVLLCPTLSAQNPDLQQFMDEHKGKAGFSHAFLSKDLFEVATHSQIKDSDWNGLHNVVKNIGSLQILAAENIQDGLELYKTAKALVPTDAFEPLLTVRDGRDNVRVWAKSEENLVTNLVLLIGAPQDFVLICFAGNLELGNLADLAALFEAGKSRQLAQAAQLMAIEFGISPNPSSGQITLSYSDEQDPPANLSILDQGGRTVLTMPLSGAATQNLQLDGLSSGNYWVQLKTSKGKIGVKQLQLLK